MKQKPTINDLKLVINKWGGKNIPTVYLEGESWYEVLQILANKIYESLEWIDDYFDADLETIVDQILNKWDEDGRITEIIKDIVNEWSAETKQDIKDLESRTDTKLDELSNLIANDINDKLKEVEQETQSIRNSISDLESKLDDESGITGSNIEAIKRSIKENTEQIGVNKNEIDKTNKDLKEYKERYQFKSVKDYGAKGNGTADDTDSIAEAINDLKAGESLYFPEGTYKYSKLPNLAKANTAIIGDGSNSTILKYTGTGSAIEYDAFASGSPTDPFIDNVKLKGFTIQGDTMKIGISAQGLARSVFDDIIISGTDGTDGTVGIQLAGVMLSDFRNIFVSYVHADKLPYRGMLLKPGSRAGSSVGACSNDTFTNVYLEGVTIGCQAQFNGVDQSVWISGAIEKCSRNGILISKMCRYNAFIGVGFENKGIEQWDISDQGDFNLYKNCYSNEKVILTGFGNEISGGYYNYVEVHGNRNKVNNIKTHHWDISNGGLVYNGKGAKFENITNSKTEETQYIWTARTNIPAESAGDNQLDYTNTESVPVRLIVRGGSNIQDVRLYRGGDYVDISYSESTEYILGAGERLTMTYSEKPTLQIMPFNTF